MFKSFVKKYYRPRAIETVPRGIAGLDRHALEDIGVPPRDIASASPAGRIWNSAVIASGLSARWSLSGDWDTIRNN